MPGYSILNWNVSYSSHTYIVLDETSCFIDVTLLETVGGLSFNTTLDLT